jgi:hypothetical protein
LDIAAALYVIWKLDLLKTRLSKPGRDGFKQIFAVLEKQLKQMIAADLSNFFCIFHSQPFEYHPNYEQDGFFAVVGQAG